ncbi:hypothetical protein PTSG_07845 [Salpingoeca rosetta]|uniref:Uncharacterized protein n=1 Tax=Salpingoeca rosetta (strain ATCC 50818 / BSB-021) TaxID=946362 RepID=F2UGH9_SALR5|nr:uncharacterized protein PTSG_07845 [Salpingoeca rosetta]EGD75729.1 hypothetical protein PTSG_07845 [Salpingoeca rosetta]|eukprot:XP_004991650.1 hypothetical protein PTSG_07845 [Salpingoeca rosetta]
MRFAVVVVAVVLLAGTTIAEDENLTISLFQDSDTCRMETINSLAMVVQVEKLDGRCHQLPELTIFSDPKPSYYKLTYDATKDKVTGSLFCKDDTCTNCGAELKRKLTTECFEVADTFGQTDTGSYLFSASVQRSEGACIGPGDIPRPSLPELLMFQYFGSNACTLGGNATATIQNLGRADSTCRKPAVSTLYQKVEAVKEGINLYLDCHDSACHNCGSRIQIAQTDECNPLHDATYVLNFQENLQGCATYPRHNISSETGAIAGGIIGALFVVLIVFLYVSRLRSKDRSTYNRI